MIVTILSGDITTFFGDAIVNAANNKGLGGGGVDGAIHRAAGPELREACAALPVTKGQGWGPGLSHTNEIRVPDGGAIPTPAFRLFCRWIIHTAGPVWPESNAGVDAAQKVLRNCYRKPAEVAMAMGLKGIAYPAISTGIYGCPMKTCAEVALQWAKGSEGCPIDVTFYILPDDGNLAIWQAVARDLGLVYD